MKAVLVIAMLVTALRTKSYKMETHSSGSLIAQLIKTNLCHKYLEEQNLLRAQVLTKASQPIIDYYDEFYTGNITFGTPGQNVSVLLDMGSSNLWVIDSTCRTGACNGYLSFYTRRKFNRTKSSTFSPENGTITVDPPKMAYEGSKGRFDATYLAVFIVFTLQGLKIDEQEFITAEDLSDIFGHMPFDGILGLGWPALSVANVTSPMQNILPNLDAPLFTVWLDRKLNVSTGGSGGLITYGAFDAMNCQPEITYVPLTSKTYWQFSIEGFSVGDFSEKKTEDAVSDTGTTFIGVPFNIIYFVASETGAEFDYEKKVYTVNCSTMMTQPDLQFIINGVKYNISSEEYVVDIELGGGKCALTFFEFDSGDVGPAWILCVPWIRTYCNIFDFGQGRIGFAKAKHSESKNNFSK